MGIGIGSHYWSLGNVLWYSVQVHCITNKELNETVVTRIRVPFWEFLLSLIKIIQKLTQKESQDIFIGVWEKKTTRQASCKSQQWLGEGRLRRESLVFWSRAAKGDLSATEREYSLQKKQEECTECWGFDWTPRKGERRERRVRLWARNQKSVEA